MERYKAEIDLFRNASSMSTGTCPVQGTSGAADLLTSIPNNPEDGRGYQTTNIAPMPSAATPLRDGASGMVPPRTPKPLVRTYGSSESFTFGGLTSPQPEGDRRLSGEDEVMDVDNRDNQASRSALRFSSAPPVTYPTTPARPRTHTSHAAAHLAYPSPASPRRNADGGPSTFGQHSTPSKGSRADLSEQVAPSPGRVQNVISYVWSMITPFSSGEGRRVVSFQEAINTVSAFLHSSLHHSYSVRGTSSTYFRLSRNVLPFWIASGRQMCVWKSSTS